MLNYLRSIKVSQRIFDMVMECIDNANEVIDVEITSYEEE